MTDFPEAQVETELAMNADPKVVGADVTDGDLLVSFDDQTTVLFRASFLHAARTDDGNHALDESLDADRYGERNE